MSSLKEIMSALKVTVVDHDYGIKSFPLSLTNEEQKILYNHIRNLELENKMLKQNAINNDHVVDKVNWENRLFKDRIDKAIEHLHKRNEQNSSALTNKEETIISKHELLKLEITNNKILEDILRGEDNE